MDGNNYEGLEKEGVSGKYIIKITRIASIIIRIIRCISVRILKTKLCFNLLFHSLYKYANTCLQSMPIFIILSSYN